MNLNERDPLIGLGDECMRIKVESEEVETAQTEGCSNFISSYLSYHLTIQPKWLTSAALFMVCISTVLYWVE